MQISWLLQKPFDLALHCKGRVYPGSAGQGLMLRGLRLSRMGWLGEAKVTCILRYLGTQLILAYIWTRPAVLAAGEGRGGMFLFLLFCHFFIFLFLPIPLFHLLLFYLFSPFLWETAHGDPQGLTCH